MSHFITEDHTMKELVELARTVAQSKATVLIQGESGTGKELLARLVHENSIRKNGPFVSVNCAAIPENQLEAELLGNDTRPGKFEAAQGGTLLLDEISEMDMKLQAKLLRAIQEGELERGGGTKNIRVDIRIIATTHLHLADCVEQGAFREDLFYRLNVVNVTLPALRERKVDVKPLAQHYLTQFSARDGKSIEGFTPGALAKLEAHSWPGNVRELENVIERAVITCRETWITEREIAVESRGARSGSASFTAGAMSGSALGWAPGQTMDEIEKGVILEALRYHNGNRTHTAKALGISIRTLRNKLADYRRIGIRV